MSLNIDKLFQNWYLLGVKMNLGLTHKTNFSGCFQNFRQLPSHFDVGAPHPLIARVNIFL